MNESPATKSNPENVCREKRLQQQWLNNWRDRTETKCDIFEKQNHIKREVEYSDPADRKDVNSYVNILQLFFSFYTICTFSETTLHCHNADVDFSDFGFWADRDKLNKKRSWIVKVTVYISFKKYFYYWKFEKVDRNTAEIARECV